MSDVHRQLHTMFTEQADVPRKLRALWALHVTGGLDDTFLIRQLDHTSEHVRAWAVQLLCESRHPPQVALNRFRELAANGDSQFVRLHLASALQRLSLNQRWPLAEALVTRAEDAGDANLPLMIWYGVEPLVEDDVGRFVKLAAQSRIAMIGRHVARRAVSNVAAEDGLDALMQLLRASGDDVIEHVLSGILQGLAGRRTVRMPDAWPQAYASLTKSPHAGVRESALRLALVFDDPVALKSLRKQAADRNAAATVRNRAIQALVAKKADDLAPLMLELIQDHTTRNAALRGLAEYQHPATASTILEHYASFDRTARADAVQTLASRLDWAMSLMDAVESRHVSRTDLTAYTARQMRALGDDHLIGRVKSMWGELRSTRADRAKLIATYRKRLTPASMDRADPVAGRLVFQKTCANCHRLFDTGENVGPEITGSQRKNFDYMLENLLDPSAAVSKDYQMQVFQTAAGRVITGLVVAESKTAVTIQTVNEKLIVPADEIESRTRSSVSMMPDGLLRQLSTKQVRDLFSYLSSPSQVPLPDSGENTQSGRKLRN